ncbi:MAG TPA: VCBS repeat-containing protein [bacterium]
MKYTMIITHMFPALLWAQEYQFQREWDSVQVEIQGYNLPAGWTGGYIRSCPDFCDIDADGDLDAFVGSFNGRLELWENQGSSAQFAFHLTDPTFQGLDSLQATWPEFWDMDSDGDLDLFLYN